MNGLSLLRVATLYELRKATAFKAGFLVREVISGFERPLVMIFVYLAIFERSGTGEIRGFTFPAMVSYLLTAALLLKLVMNERGLDLAEQIFEGYVTKFFVMPARFFTLILARWVQYTLVQVVVVSVSWSIGLLLVPDWWPRPVSALAIAQAATLVLAGSYCFLLLIFMINALAFWLDVVWSLLNMSRFILGFAGGLIVPVAIMPELLREAFWWAFPYWTISAPAEIVMGRLGSGEFVSGLGVLGVTAVVLQVAAGLTWRAGLRRYSGSGM